MPLAMQQGKESPLQSHTPTELYHHLSLRNDYTKALIFTSNQYFGTRNGSLQTEIDLWKGSNLTNTLTVQS